MTYWVGTDVGGTFTDLWALSDGGRQEVVKVPTTPDIVDGIVQALELVAARYGTTVRGFCEQVEHFGHGTTAGLNALLTGTAARTALVTTRGFGDTLEIGRLKRQLAGMSELEIGDYTKRGRWPPLVDRTLVFEARERVDRDGRVVVPLTGSEVASLVDRVSAASVEAIAVATLWSIANPVHELEIGRALLDALPGVFVTMSHRVAPGVGEYARTSTAVANAALGPVMASYLERLGTELRARGLQVPVLMMTGEGGVVSVDVAAEEPVSVLISGPAACVVACQQLGRRLGTAKVLSVDVGGTSFDVGTVVDGRVTQHDQVTVGGADIRRPTVDVATIGAGGGSIARVVDGTLLVGPQSAGAVPGPVCYGRGGQEPTATDADLVLGVLDEEWFVGGSMGLDRQAALDALDARVARPLGVSPVAAAWAVRQVLDSRMADLLRSVTIERGNDPREFVLFASGGQGPSHAWALCRDLGIAQFVVTPVATVQSAFGTGTSDWRRSVTRPHYLRMSPGHDVAAGEVEGLGEALAELTTDALERFGPRVDASGLAVSKTAAVRYRGQAHHLDVQIADDLDTAAALEKTLQRFEALHEALYGAGSGSRAAGFEVLSLRVAVTRHLARLPSPRANEVLAATGSRRAVFDDPDEWVECAVFRTASPAPGQHLEGPCLVEYQGQTLVLPPTWTAETDEWGNVVARWSPAARDAARDGAHDAAGAAAGRAIGSDRP